MEKHAVARLIGSPPGYVGFNRADSDRGRRRTLHAVLLLDEIEKAHEDIFNILQIDHAALTDNTGRNPIYNIILTATSNAGAREMSQSAIGFEIHMAALNKEGAPSKSSPRPATARRDNRLWPLTAEVMLLVVDNSSI